MSTFSISSFVLVIQDHLLDYLQAEFNFTHLNEARIGDTMHIHAYTLDESDALRLNLARRVSTDAAGVAKCLNIQAETKMGLETILEDLNRKLSDKTLLQFGFVPPPAESTMPTE